MISIILTTPHEMAEQLAQRARERRLALNLSQAGLAERSGVSLGVLKKFERTGKISLESLLKIALPLGALDEFNALLQPKNPIAIQSLDSILQQKARKRGRK
jgi:transcriptional regulator with XRE-family HTH domain